MAKLSQREENFRKRVLIWREAFLDETTGIYRTIGDLLWHYAAFATLVKIVGLAAARREGEPAINQMLFDLAAEGFWANLLLGTRRLLDGGCLKGETGVYSLRSVISDVEACLPMLTRRRYIEVVRQAPYDYYSIELREQQRVLSLGSASWVDNSSLISRCAHSDFDKMSGTDEASRSEGDVILPAVLQNLEKRLASLDSIGKFVSSHIAHSGNFESRAGKSLGDAFDIRESRLALKNLQEIAGLVGLWFANTGAAGLAVYQGDQFAGLDAPLVRPEQISELTKHWREIEQDIEQWSISDEDL